MKKTALDIYRSLPQSERAAYRPPSGMRGAPAVRDLQYIAAYLAAAQRGVAGCDSSPDRLIAMREAYIASTRSSDLTTIPLGLADRDAVRTIVHAANSRLKNWNIPLATADRAANRKYRTINEGRYSSRCTYTHYTYTPTLLSAGRVADDGSVLGAVIDQGTYTIPAPRGYRWGLDLNGIRLYRITSPADDYHPTSDDIRAGSRHIVAALRKHAATRRQARREKQQQDTEAKRACAHGVWVSIEDSRAAGNCAAGTLAYCERHNLDCTRHYRAEVLLRAENSDRVHLAITTARQRQIADWRRGLSDIPHAHRPISQVAAHNHATVEA